MERSTILPRRSEVKTTVLRWSLVWLVLGAACGTLMALVGDLGHMPPILAPVALALMGALGGVVGGLLFAATSSIIARNTGLSLPARTALGAPCGALAGMVLYYAGLGATMPYSVAGGTVAGVASALLSLVAGQREVKR